jgi:hypothetical protein
LLKDKVYGLLLLATPSSKPLPLRLLGLALLELQVLTILWLLVVVAVVIFKLVAAVLVGLERGLGYLLAKELITQLP